MAETRLAIPRPHGSMSRMNSDARHIRDLTVERLTLVDPSTSQPRAILELGDSKSPKTGLPTRAVRLRLLRPDGETALVAEVLDDGEARVSVGHPDRGIAVIVMRDGIDDLGRGWGESAGDGVARLLTRVDIDPLSP